MPRTPVTDSPLKRQGPTTPPELQELPKEPLAPTRPGASPKLAKPIEPAPGAMMLATGSAAVYHRLRASMHPDAFEHHDGNAFPLVTVNESDAKGAIELKPPHVDGLAILPADELSALADEMWRHASELSPLEADTLDALSHLWMGQAQHPQDRVTADIDALLKLRGLKPKKSGSGRRGGYMPEQRREMLHALARIQNLWLRMEELTTYTDNGGKSKKSRRETRKFISGPAFVITGAAGQVRLDGSLDVESVRFTPGDVLGLYLWGPGRQTALLDAKALQLDPYRQEPEKLLYRYLSWQWKIRATKGTYSEPYRVSTLLEVARLQLDTRKPIRTLNRLEKALDTLHAAGMIAGWRYNGWSLGSAPARGWAEGWLRALVAIEPPASIVSHYLGNLRGALPDNAGAGASLDERLRDTRERLKLSQAQASEACDVSQQTYSRAERGKGVSAENRGKLEAWLATHSPAE